MAPLHLGRFNNFESTLKDKKNSRTITCPSFKLGNRDTGKSFRWRCTKTSAIEGEKLDVHSIRSSVARRLGLPSAGISKSERKIDGLIEMLLDATINYKNLLTPKRVKDWQAGFFPTGFSGIHEMQVGNWLESSEPMRVVSRMMGK